MDFNVNNFTPAANNLFKNVAEGLPNIMQIIGKDVVALTKNRLQEQNVDSEGSTFPPYTEKYKKVKAKKKRRGKR